jgi:hypothetical protein
MLEQSMPASVPGGLTTRPGSDPLSVIVTIVAAEAETAHAPSATTATAAATSVRAARRDERPPVARRGGRSFDR